MNKLKILIVEDDQNIAESLSEMLTVLDHNVVGIAASFGEGINILKNNIVELALVDIQLKGEKTGIDLAAKIREDYGIPFIFTTAFADSETINLATQENPYGYIVKPYGVKDINTSISVALANHIKTTKWKEKEGDILFKDCMFVKTNSRLVRVDVDSILYIEAKGDYALFVTEKKGYIINSIFKNIEQKLDPNRFIRVHRSYIVNIKKVIDIEDSSLLINEKVIPISRGQKANLMDKLDLM